MKKISLIALVLFSVMSVKSQSLEDINDLMGQSKFNEAKTAIDKYFTNPKKANDAEGYYYKGRIYNSLSRDTAFSFSLMFEYKSEAFEAFKKNQALDAKDVYLMLENHTSYLDLYFGFYDLGAKDFNAKKFGDAVTAFKKANEVKDYILSKKYEYSQTKLYALDTSLILNIAASAIQNKQENIAVEYYKKLTDLNVDGADYKELYQFIIEYYIKTNDAENLKSILTKAKKLYPGDDYWIDIELKAAGNTGNKADLLAKYEELLAENPTSFLLAYNYSVELYNSLYGRDASSAGSEAVSDKLTEIAKKAIANESKTDITATVLMCNHLFNYAADELNASNMIKSTKPEDVKKKAALKAIANKTMDECIVYAETAMKFYEGLSSRTPIQKANYKIVLGYLSDIYSVKKNTAKAAEYEKKNAAADKL